MEAYAGFEPRVGEIRALRTFRIGPGGVLYPLFSNTPWSDGTNTARCHAGAASDESGRASGTRTGLHLRLLRLRRRSRRG